ncbi:MAG: mycofactocin system FadH/OYE family oxidoreductase 1, partial [Actinomycetes bacterium]
MPNLSDPFDVGALTAPSRVVFGPHETNLGRNRSLSDRHVAYYARRAEGGAGIVVTEEASVHPSDHPYERAPLAVDCAHGWAAIANAVHAEGALVLAALGHAGGQGTSHWNQQPLLAPSRVPEVNTREVPKWMEPSDIAAVIDGFARAAALAVRSGCDGVEVNAGQYSLVRQFLSGLTNQRDDEWGQDRTLFARQVLTAIRAAVGGDALVALRLSCDELAPWAGITPEQAPELAADLCDVPDGRVDLLTVVRGSIFSVGATRPDGHTPPAFNTEVCRAVRASVRERSAGRIPVVLQGSVVDVDQATWAIEDGVADAVEMTRAQLADARLVAKVRAGTPDRVRPCVLCNQVCQVRDNRNPIVSCIADPRTGFETVDPDVRSNTLAPDPAVVVGGGPAGLEAARVLALRGHAVHLIEGSDQLGGAVRTAARGAGRERLALLVDWLESECRRLGVTITTGRTASIGDLGGGERVVVATGALPGDRSFHATRTANVRTAAEVLDALDDLDSVLGAGAVLVWDPIGGPIGVSVAESLAAAGVTVHLATQDHIVGNELSRSGDLAPANARLQQAGVTLHRRVVLRKVTARGAELEGR